MRLRLTVTPLFRTDFEATFQAVVAEHLRRTPWLGLSLAVHGVAALLLSLLPNAPRPREAVVVHVQPAQAVPMIEEVAPPREELVPEHSDPAQLVDLTEPVDAMDAVVDPSVDPSGAEVPDPMRGAVDGFGGEWGGAGNNTAIGIGGGGGMPARYRGRGTRGGGGAGAGGAPVRTAVDAALLWLRAHQDGDGRWDCDEFMKHDGGARPCDGAGDPLHDVGVTGLALLAFLGDGSTLRSGPHCDVIKRGVDWLRAQQDADTGCLGTASSQHFIYDHTIATLALCEAQGLSRYRTLKPAVQKSLDYLQAHRNPYGTWRYQPRSGDNDMSVTGWAIMALLSGHEFGFAVDRRALQLADAYIDELTDAEGRVGYLVRGGLSSRHVGRHAAQFPVDRNECMTGVGLLCKVLLRDSEKAAQKRDPKTDPTLQRLLAVIMRKKPAWHSDATGSSLDFCAWYAGSYAVYQMGEPHWAQWSRALNDAVLKRQRSDACFAGSWDPVDAWGDDGGRVYATAILALTLQAYYRYARVIAGR